MRRLLLLLAALVALTALLGCKKKICGPYVEMNLPGITKIDRCDTDPKSDYGFGGETTASGADFVKAIAQSGYEVGRDGGSSFGHAKNQVYFRKDGATYMMFTDLTPRPGGNNFFSIVPQLRGDPKTWVADASYQKLLTTHADRDALIDRLRSIRALLATSEGTRAPAKCDAALEPLDPDLAKSPKSMLVNLDAIDFDKERKTGRGPKLFHEAVHDAETEYSAKVSNLLAARAEVDQFAARRVIPTIAITHYVPVKSSGPAGDTNISFISGGEAKLDVAVVDLKENRVLCRTKVEVRIGDKSRKPPKDAPTLKVDGGTVAVWFNVVSPNDSDLDTKIVEATIGELGKMNPVFTR